eukprot:gene8505-9375_t
MASYLDTPDSDQESASPELVELTEAEKVAILSQVSASRVQGNDHFAQGQYEDALTQYNEAVNLLKKNHLDKDVVILLNRAATFLALKRYVPALNDANQAIELDPSNWKGHWRKGVALMSMAKRQFRTKQAIAAFEACAQCSTLPDNKKKDVQGELTKARARYAQQDAESPPADLSKCAPS